MWIYMEMKGLLQDGTKMLHMAPEQALEAKFRQRENFCYLTADLHNRADLEVNLTSLPLASDRFDLVYCSNVLEHIEDDAQAISELHRVVCTGGLAIVQVPVRGEVTVEDPTVTSPEERDRLFGQWDHVRYYGRDVKHRLEEAGFVVGECWMPDALNLSEQSNQYFGVAKRELIHLCHKR